MTELDQTIQHAYENSGNIDAANKVYLKFLQTLLFIPVKKDNPTDEAFLPLYSKIEDQYFMLAFDTLEKLESWAGEYLAEMGVVQVSGHDVILGINNNVFLSLNLGCEFHKEFSPDEVKHLKKIVARIESLKSG